MKKLVVLFMFSMFTASLNWSCTKCGCDIGPPIMTLSLVIKDLNGQDLLSPTVNGYYSQNDIHLYKKSTNGSLSLIKFDVLKSPIWLGNKKVEYYQLISAELITQAANQLSGDTLFLQLRNETPNKILLQLNRSAKSINLYLDGYEAIKDDKMTFTNSLFYYTKK